MGTLYQLLGVEPDASGREIQRAYYKLSLVFHPDRCVGGDQEEAKRRFQEIGRAYAVLGNEQYRQAYDQTGQMPGEEAGGWKGYFESVFAEVTIDKLDRYREQYQRSEEERQDLMDLYQRHRGDMDRIADGLLFYSVDEEARYVDVIRSEVEARGWRLYRKFGRSARKQRGRKRRARREEEEAAALAKSLGVDSAAGLIQRIHGRGERRDEFIEQLATKYGGCSRKRAARE